MSQIRSIVRCALASTLRLPASFARTGRRSLALGAVALVASTVGALATANTAPHFTSLGASASVLDEGQTLTVSGTFVDPDATDSHTILIYWQGSTLANYTDPFELGAERIQLPAGATTFQATHRYTDDASPRTFTVAVSDHQAPVNPNENQQTLGREDQTLPITVRNVAPSFSPNISVTHPRGQPVVVEGTIVDPGADTFVVLANWGDGSTPPGSPGTQAWPCSVEPRTRHFGCQHAYRTQAIAKTYRILLGVQDDDGGNGTATTSVQIPAGG